MAYEDQAALLDLVAREYDLTLVAAEAGPRGWVGETHILTAADGTRFFAKIVPTPDDLAPVVARLAVLEALRAAGFAHLTFPLRTRAGALTVRLDDRYLVLFDYINGESSEKVGYEVAQFVTLLARIHQVAVPAIPDVPRETFGMVLAPDFQRHYATALHPSDPTPPQAAMQAFLHPHVPQIARDWEELLALAAQCREAAWMPHITHSDALGHNLLVNATGRIALIDWDELALAPVERDTWCALVDPQRRAPFLQHYRAIFPGYQPNLLFCRFYLLQRFFEDLDGYLSKINEVESLAEQQMYLDGMVATEFTWLWPWLRLPLPPDM